MVRKCMSRYITRPFPQYALKKPKDTPENPFNTRSSGSVSEKEGTDFKKLYLEDRVRRRDPVRCDKEVKRKKLMDFKLG